MLFSIGLHLPGRRAWLLAVALATAVGCITMHSAQAAPAAGVAATSSTQNVVRAGAPTDGTSDATAVFQRLLDQAGAAGGGTVEVPAGTFVIRGNLRIPANVTLRGVAAFAAQPSLREGSPGPVQGTVLHAYAGRGTPEAAPFILMDGDNSAIAGLTIAYPEWSAATIPPAPYPPCIMNRKGVENIAILDLQLQNPYEGIHLDEAHRFLVRNVMGYPVWRGLFVDFCVDIGRVENIHYWPFGVTYKPDDPYCKWINTNSVAFEFARTDWIYVANTFCFGYRAGYLFSDHGRGGTNGNFVGIGADSCQEAVRVEGIQPYGIEIVNGNFVGRWSSTDAVTFHVLPKAAGKISLLNSSFWGPIDRCVVLEAPEAQFSATACHFHTWDERKVGSAALQLDAGRAIVQGCTFGAGARDIHIGKGIIYATIFGNQGVDGVEIVNDAPPAASQLGLNEPPHPAAPPTPTPVAPAPAPAQ